MTAPIIAQAAERSSNECGNWQPPPGGTIGMRGRFRLFSRKMRHTWPSETDLRRAFIFQILRHCAAPLQETGQEPTEQRPGESGRPTG